MIQIHKKEDCCGCHACVQVCPKQCILMHEDKEGFLYPQTNKSVCIDCGLCEKICPVINQSEPHKPIKVYAAKNPNEEVRMASSSGGIFTLLAERTINNGGVVFGARFDDKWEVVHDYNETIEGIAPFRGSKYVQSIIGDNYLKAERFLKQGREVLFTGTPCQIAGLKKYLRKDYENLIAVDVVCHGVPSPLVWREYLKTIIRPKGDDGKNTVSFSLKEMQNISCISFRDKSTGWKKYGFVVSRKSASEADKNTVLSSVNKVVLHETLDKNLFMQGFLKNLYLRTSCYSCPSKSGKSGSDITIADYWGIENVLPEMDDNKGTSLVLCNTEKGLNALSSIDAKLQECIYEDAVRYNSAIVKSSKEPSNRNDFWGTINQRSIGDQIKKFTRPTIVQRIRMSLPVRAIRWAIRKITNK